MGKAIQAAQYFKGQSGYERLFFEFYKKYKSLQRIGGVVTIKNVTPEEIKTFEGFFAKKMRTSSEHINISMSSFEVELQKTTFVGISLLELLEAYYDEIIIGNRDEKEMFEFEKVRFFKEMCEKSEGENSTIILEKIIQKRPGTVQVHALYQKNKPLLSLILPFLFAAVNALPLASPKRLPLFASQITGNPHFFDMDTEAGKILVSFLQALLESEKVKEYESVPGVEELTEILNYYGIWRDDILNFVTCYGVRGYKENGELFKVMEGANSERTPCNVLLRDVFRLKKVEVNNNCVFVVENSSLYSSIIDFFEKEAEMPSIICTHGQMKLSAIRLLSKISDAGNVIYYSGDYDPEGLIIAQTLIRRIGENVRMWRYDIENYISSYSNVDIKPVSLKKLDGINDSRLKEVAGLMQLKKKAGYQERLLDAYIQDIREVMKPGE
jgi:uncharacterized protein (TIGR02679 family)